MSGHEYWSFTVDTLTAFATVVTIAWLLLWVGGFLRAWAEDRADRRDVKRRRALWMRDWGHDPVMVKKFDETHI
jgi:hypothetical protein